MDAYFAEQKITLYWSLQFGGYNALQYTFVMQFERTQVPKSIPKLHATLWESVECSVLARL